MIVFFFLAAASFVGAIGMFLSFAGMEAHSALDVHKRNRGMVTCAIWVILSAIALGGAAEFTL